MGSPVTANPLLAVTGDRSARPLTQDATAPW